jgi:signal-transduction protein with cAMP-binding, CBS, and nucleotidyltransferase domain
MAKTIGEVMTRDPVTLPADSPVRDAAVAMRDSDIGDVIVLEEGDRICGIVTDRDLALRVIGEGRELTTKLGDICTRDINTVSPDTGVSEAVRLMTSESIRRLPVVEGGRPVGIVSLGDLAISQDPDSALADISADEPNS